MCLGDGRNLQTAKERRRAWRAASAAEEIRDEELTEEVQRYFNDGNVVLEQRKSSEGQNLLDRRGQRRSNVSAKGNDAEQLRTRRDRAAAAADASTSEAAATHSVHATTATLGAAAPTTTAKSIATASARVTATTPQGHGSSPRHHQDLNELRRLQGTQSDSASNLKLIASALSGKSVAFSKVISMFEGMVALLKVDLGDDERTGRKMSTRWKMTRRCSPRKSRVTRLRFKSTRPGCSPTILT